MADEETTQDELETPEPEAVAPDALDFSGDLSDEEQAELKEALDRFAAQFSGEDEPDETPDEPAEPVEEPEPEPVPTVAAAPVSQPAPSARGVVVIDGHEIPVEEAVKFLVEREKAQAPPPEPPKPPEWLDQDDPMQVAMWTELQQVKASQAQVAQNQQQLAYQTERARLTQEVEAGVGTFRTGHPELTEDDIGTIRLHAAALNIIPGMAQHMSGPDAVLKALDMAYKDLPEFQARANGVPTPAEKKKAVATQRKGKLNTLHGSSGSAARTEAKPDLSTDNSAKAAAADWLKAQNIL